MGCGGCELFPPPGEILANINRAAARTGVTIDSKAIFKALVDDCFAKIQNPGPEFKRVVNTTNIWHLRESFAEKVRRDHGTAARDAVELVIRRAITCYAAKLHLNKGVSIVNPTRHPHKGYAPIFENVTQFKGRVAKAAKLKDLLGSADPVRPWKDALPRMLFVSDMGDALSTKGDSAFLKGDMMPAIRSERGSKHLWLWLSKLRCNGFLDQQLFSWWRGGEPRKRLGFCIRGRSVCGGYCSRIRCRRRSRCWHRRGR